MRIQMEVDLDDVRRRLEQLWPIDRQGDHMGEHTRGWFVEQSTLTVDHGECQSILLGEHVRIESDGRRSRLQLRRGQRRGSIRSRI